MTTHGERNDSSDSGQADGPDRPATPVELAWAAHISDETELLDRLVIRHRERQRRYHKISHIDAVLAAVAELVEAEPVDDLGAVTAAVLYHDAIYEPQHPANERASARLARRDLTALGWDAQRVDAVAAMIEGTKTHLDPTSRDAAVLNDADLSILGADPDDYARYVTAVRAEYSHLDDGEWNAGRADVMQAFLDRESIYATAAGRSRWEAAARANITAEVDSLQH